MAGRFAFSLLHQVKRNKSLFFSGGDQIKRRWSSSYAATNLASSAVTNRNLNVNLEKYGIGGLGVEFAELFRRGFAFHLLPRDLTDKLGVSDLISPVKGIILYGPPGTGKSLVASQIGKMLQEKEVKVVFGPHLNGKRCIEGTYEIGYFFTQAAGGFLPWGEPQLDKLHVMIIEDIDALAKQSASNLLKGMEESSNNILIIGTTRRKELLNKQLFKSGHFEVQIEIKRPDERGRLEILQVLTNKMKSNSFLGPDVYLPEIAARTPNCSGGQLKAVVKIAVSFALNRLMCLDEQLQENGIGVMVTRDDFLNAIRDVVPGAGASIDDLNRIRVNGMVDCGEQHKIIYQRAMLLVEQVKSSKNRSPPVSCLLEGPSGSGKSALAATLGITSDFPYVNIVTPEPLTFGLDESAKCKQIVKVFEDAYKWPLSIIIIDDIERLLMEDYAGGDASSSSSSSSNPNLICKTLMALLKRVPPSGTKILVIGTTSKLDLLESTGLLGGNSGSFNATYHVPTLGTEDAKKVLQHLNVFGDETEICEAAKSVSGMPIKKLFRVIEMARAEQGRRSAETFTFYSGKNKNITSFLDCVQKIRRSVDYSD